MREEEEVQRAHARVRKEDHTLLPGDQSFLLHASSREEGETREFEKLQETEKEEGEEDAWTRCED